MSRLAVMGRVRCAAGLMGYRSPRVRARPGGLVMLVLICINMQQKTLVPEAECFRVCTSVTESMRPENLGTPYVETNKGNFPYFCS